MSTGFATCTVWWWQWYIYIYTTTTTQCKLQCMPMQGPVRECALVSEGISVAASVELVVVLLLVAVMALDGVLVTSAAQLLFWTCV